MMENIFSWLFENKEIVGAGVGAVIATAAGFIQNRYLSYVRLAKRLYVNVKTAIAKAKEKKK
jgi:hypothetical protein